MSPQSIQFLFALAKFRLHAVLAILMIVPLITACGRRQQLDPAWSHPETFAHSKEALNSTFGIVQLNGMPVCVDGSDYYFLGTDGADWKKKTFLAPISVANSLFLPDPASTRFILQEGSVRDGTLHGAFVFCSLDPESGIRKLYDRNVALEPQELFGEIRKSRNEQPVEKIWRQQYGPPQIKPSSGCFGWGVSLGEAVHVPYTVECSAFYGSRKEAGGSGPAQTGMLSSTGDHSRWTKVKLFDVRTFAQGIFASRDNLYFLANRIGEQDLKTWGLWCVRMPRTEAAQPAAELVAHTFCHTVFGKYSAVTSGETIHLIWLDERHERNSALRVLRSGGGPPGEANFEIYYCKRDDSGTEWTKEVLLSKGIDFAFAPQMAVDGESIVVVWAGHRRDRDKTYAEFHPSDIYFTTSRDEGKTWAATTRATDNAKSGSVSGRPQVVLHNGVIHLFYIRGKPRENVVAPGLRLLNQPPWDIIYQHRLFPEG